ncbi:hypothetical protein AB0I28_12285 [Phytomonospora sp. NPDC050363]|uniref:hypothetical protein n=1 Tax=Phytomonospora sp. NPDC050363 TaxID=3155642 RepID=UPI0033EDD49B
MTLYLIGFVAFCFGVTVALAALIDPACLGLGEGPSPAERAIRWIQSKLTAPAPEVVEYEGRHRAVTS